MWVIWAQKVPIIWVKNMHNPGNNIKISINKIYDKSFSGNMRALPLLRVIILQEPVLLYKAKIIVMEFDVLS